MKTELTNSQRKNMDDIYDTAEAGAILGAGSALFQKTPRANNKYLMQLAKRVSKFATGGAVSGGSSEAVKNIIKNKHEKRAEELEEKMDSETGLTSSQTRKIRNIVLPLGLS